MYFERYLPSVEIYINGKCYCFDTIRKFSTKLKSSSHYTIQYSFECCGLHEDFIKNYRTYSIDKVIIYHDTHNENGEIYKFEDTYLCPDIVMSQTITSAEPGIFKFDIFV